MLERFPIISSLAVTTGIAVDCSRENFFLEEIFESKQATKSASGSKNNIKLTECYIFSIVCLKCAFKSSEDLRV